MKRKIVQIVLLSVCLLTDVLPGNAQTYEVNLGDVVKTKVKTEEFIGTDPAGNIYVSGIRPRIKMYLPLMAVNLVDINVEKYVRKYDSQMQLISDREILSENPLIRQSQINGRVKYLSVILFHSMNTHNMDLPTFMIGDKYYIVSQDSKPPRNNYFLLEVNTETGAVNQMTHLMALSKNKNDDERKVKEFKVRFSPDSSHILFLATYEKDKSSKTGVAYSASVFTRDISPVFTSSYTLPKASKTYTIKDAQLTNKGEVLIIGRQFDKKQKENPGYVSVFSIDKTTTKPKETRLKFGGAAVNDVLLSLNSSEEPLLIGFYKDKSSKRGYDGVFHASLNENKEVYDISKKEFTGEFITSDYTVKQAKKINRKEKKGKDITEDGDFGFSEFIKTTDGGYMAVAENYYVVKVTRTTTNRNVTTTHTDYHHYYNDMMVFKFDREGKLQTMNKIAKRTKYISSSPAKIHERDYTSFDYDGDVFLVFNDDAENMENSRRGTDMYHKDATYIVCVKPDGSLKKDVLIERKQLGKFAFNPHKKLQKLGGNKMAFIATKANDRGRKSILGTFSIKKS